MGTQWRILRIWVTWLGLCLRKLVWQQYGVFTRKRKDRDSRENALQESRCVAVRVYGSGKEGTDGRDVDREALMGDFQGLFWCMEVRRGRSQLSWGFILCKGKNRSTMSRNWRNGEGISLAKTEFDFGHDFHSVNNGYQTANNAFWMRGLIE